jgi:excisionase family DNA binding protein
MCTECQRPPKQFLIVTEIAEELAKSERSVWRLLKTGKLPAYQFGSSTRVKREDFDRYIERCRRKTREDDADDDKEPSESS